MNKKQRERYLEELTRPMETVVRDPDAPWVLTSTAPSGFSRARLVSGLLVYQDSQNRMYVTPLGIGTAETDHLTLDYRKSGDGNDGKISFSSYGTRFEVRALRLEDSSWLFPGRQFADLQELVAAVNPS